MVEEGQKTQTVKVREGFLEDCRASGLRAPRSERQPFSFVLSDEHPHGQTLPSPTRLTPHAAPGPRTLTHFCAIS